MSRNLSRLLSSLTLPLSLAACGDEGRGRPMQGGNLELPDLRAPVDLASNLDSGPQPFIGAVYAHSATELYTIDPDTLAVAKVGKFTFTGDTDAITDIALDKDGGMVGVSRDTLYRIDPKTAACTELATIGSNFAALSYIPEDQVDPGESGSEILIGATGGSGDVIQLDPVTGKSTRIGSFGNDLAASGDIVSIRGLGTYATVNKPNDPMDYLARLDMRAGGKATIIGSTREENLFGLGFWKDKVFGFSDEKRIVTIDINTGKATLINTSTVVWWGAGVTTWAPVIIQ